MTTIIRIPWRGKTIRSQHYNRFTKATAIIGIVAVFSSVSGPVLADQYDDQINALNAQIATEQQSANAAQQQVNTYQAQVNQYNSQIQVIEDQISVNQIKSNQLNAQIADAQAKLAQEKTVLAANLKSMYLDSNVTPLEMVASSNNLSEYFNEQQYQDSIKNKIQDSLKTIEALKAQLDKQQAQVTQLLADEHNQEADVANLRNQANALLATAAQNVAAANAEVQQNNAKVASLKAQQWASIAANSRHVSGGSGCGGYPAVWCNNAQDTIIDDWGMYNRECVSYAAWAATYRYGHKVPYWGGHGNANQWPGNARAAGIPVDGTPHVGDVAIYMGGYYGHAMVVESVKSNTVVVSSFNGDGTGHFAYDEWSTSALLFIHFR